MQRDMTLIIEDPGPFIIVSFSLCQFALLYCTDCIQGMPIEARYMVAIPPDIVVVDIDSDSACLLDRMSLWLIPSSSLVCKTPPENILAPKMKRDKMKIKILAALGDRYRESSFQASS